MDVQGDQYTLIHVLRILKTYYNHESLFLFVPTVFELLTIYVIVLSKQVSLLVNLYSLCWAFLSLGSGIATFTLQIRG